MRWKAKVVPELGDTREVEKFALFPTKIHDYTVWLESYYSLQEYRTIRKSSRMGTEVYADWVETDKFMIG